MIAISDLLPGDVICYELSPKARWWQAPLARLIRLIQGNRIIHTELVLEGFPGANIVKILASEPFRGVHTRYWGGLQQSLLVPTQVFRPDIRIRPYILPPKFEGVGYGWTGILNNGICHMTRNYKIYISGEGMTCSHLVAEYLKAFGAVPPGVETRLVEPDDFTHRAFFRGQILK